MVFCDEGHNEGKIILSDWLPVVKDFVCEPHGCSKVIIAKERRRQPLVHERCNLQRVGLTD
jgi:hypothetical protein